MAFFALAILLSTWRQDLTMRIYGRAKLIGIMIPLGLFFGFPDQPDSLLYAFSPHGLMVETYYFGV
jgi:hypothetical protein